MHLEQVRLQLEHWPFTNGIVPATLPELSLAEEIATSINIVIQVILNLKPLAGVSVTAAKGHAISLPLTGVLSLLL